MRLHGHLTPTHRTLRTHPNVQIESRFEALRHLITELQLQFLQNKKGKNFSVFCVRGTPETKSTNFVSSKVRTIHK